MELSMLGDIEQKIEQGKRLVPDEGLRLLKEAPLPVLQRLAQAVRFRLHPKPIVTFVVDSNPNYTNVCVTDCVFCAFYRKPGAKGAYTLTIDEILEKVGQAARQGATTVLFQGGHNPAIPFDYYLDMVRAVREKFPQIHPHFFTASEIDMMARVSKLSTREVLSRLWEAGARTLPGGGAEVLSDRVKRRISPKKISADDWIRIHREAHELGYRSTATMMYGHIETPEDLLEHMERIRALQGETGGFTAFVPWSFKPDNTPVERKIDHASGPALYFRMLAVSRIYLDNVPHIQASWFSEGKEAGKAALAYGADDFGGTLFEENVHQAANFVNRTTVEEVVELIRGAGFIPAQRTTLYEIVRVFDEEKRS